jgi:hypothetical protein
MNALETHQKRLRNELAAVEREIRSHTQQIESLNQRLEGLKRAMELFEAEQPAVAELLRTGIADGGGSPRAMAAQSWSTGRKSLNRKTTAPPKRTGSAKSNQRGTAISAASNQPKRPAQARGGLTRVDMIAAFLMRHPAVTVRELIAGLDREFGWKPTESGITAQLYTNGKFVHTKADRASQRPVSWSLRKPGA